ncbi:MAG: YlxM family DNA-binding protein [Hornefia sp.]|nr:YlxM family DNA-binding protein [Hornefia sp.]
MNHIVKDSLLFDLYGSLLTEKKRNVMELYHEENLSLAEIAEEFGISRAAVHDSLKSAEKQLAEYEEKLSMVRRLEAMSKSLEKLKENLADIESLEIDDLRLKRKLSRLRDIVRELENNS